MQTKDYSFTLSIELGNDAMREPEDVAHALRETAELIEAGHEIGRVRDRNGNSVGNFRLDTEQDSAE